MKRKLLAAFVAIACAALNGNSQPPETGGQSDSANPPADTLVPRLEKRDTTQINRVDGTNQFRASTNKFSLGTNEFGAITNQDSLTPTGSNASSNRVYGTNSVYSTNRFGTKRGLRPAGQTNTEALTPDVQKKDSSSSGFEKSEKDSSGLNP